MPNERCALFNGILTVTPHWYPAERCAGSTHTEIAIPCTPFYGIGDFRTVNFNFATDKLELAPGGKSPLAFGSVPASNRYAMAPVHTDVGPRLGAAYQINARLVFRAAFGVFYDSQEVHGTTPDSVINPPNVYAVTLQRVKRSAAHHVFSGISL